MNYPKLSNLDFIHCLIKDSENELAWLEFYRRFHKSICYAILKESKFRNFDEGIHYPEDLAQDVYKLLVKNNCHALRTFKGEYNGSIYKFIETISARIILRKIEEANAQKRIPQDVQAFLDSPIKNGKEINRTKIGDIIPDHRTLSDSNEILEEIIYCIKKVSRKRQQTYLYRLIFQYYLFDDLRPGAIAKKPNIDRSWKRIENIISEMKRDVRECLKNRL